MPLSDNSTLLPFVRDNESVDQSLVEDVDGGGDLAVNSYEKS